MQHAAKTASKKPSKTPSKKAPPPSKTAKSAAERKADREANAKTQPMLEVVKPASLPQGQSLDTETMSDQPDAIRSPDTARSRR